VTINTNDYDPDLTGHASVVIDGVCHAVISEYNADATDRDFTECGLKIPQNKLLDIQPRKDFFDCAKMCLKCWPESVTDTRNEAEAIDE